MLSSVIFHIRSTLEAALKGTRTGSDVTSDNEPVLLRRVHVANPAYAHDEDVLLRHDRELFTSSHDRDREGTPCNSFVLFRPK